MALNRGDIVYVYFEIPNYNKSESHPALIISNNDVVADDDCYIMVMITSSEEFSDKYSFEIVDSKMLTNALPKKSQVRCHLVTNVLAKHLTRSTVLATMKSSYVDAVVDRIISSSLTE